MTDQKNTILAIVLSALVLIAWQYFVGLPQMEKQRQEAQLKAQQQQTAAAAAAAAGASSSRGQSAPPRSPDSRRAAAARPRRRADARPAAVARGRDRGRRRASRSRRRGLRGSIALKGGRIDDLALTQYRETVDPNSPPIVLLSPSGSPHPFYAEFGWVAGAGSDVKVPDADTVWRQQGVGHARRRPAGDARLRQRRRAWNSAAPSRSTTSTCSPSRTRSPTRARRRSRSIPMR